MKCANEKHNFLKVKVNICKNPISSYHLELIIQDWWYLFHMPINIYIYILISPMYLHRCWFKFKPPWYFGSLGLWWNLRHVPIRSIFINGNTMNIYIYNEFIPWYNYVKYYVIPLIPPLYVDTMNICMKLYMNIIRLSSFCRLSNLTSSVRSCHLRLRAARRRVQEGF